MKRTTNHRRHRPGRRRPVRGAGRGRRGAREKHRRADHADRQGRRSRRRRQHPLDAVLHAHGRRSTASSRRSSTTCWRRRTSRATRTTSRRSPRTRPPRCNGSPAHGVPFHQPVYYLAKGPPRIQPVGGGETIHRELTRAARDAGVVVPLRLRRRRAGRRATARSPACGSPRGETLPADAVVLACGGFQANAAMMREHFGAGGDDVPLLAPRAHFNSGDGIRMAQALGADFSGERGRHAHRAGRSALEATRRRWCCSIPTASWSAATAAASSTRARASSTRPGRRSRGACISRCRAAWPTRSSTPASAPSPTGSAPRAPRCRRSRPRRSASSPS